MFGFVYWLVLCFGYLLMLPILLALALFKTKYKQSIPARFFLYKHKKLKGDVWIHACSLGEITSLQSFIDEIKENIIISTITNTGYSKACELFGGKSNTQICYLPFEIFIPFVMPRHLKKLIVLEAELWYMLFSCAKKRNAKTYLLNARISSHSFPNYKKYQKFYSKLFSKIDIIFAQQEADKERLEALGADFIKVIGNIKALNIPKITKTLPKSKAIIAASTHKKEEELIIKNFIEAQSYREYTLLIAPRHPERFDEVWQIIQTFSLKSTRYSTNAIDCSYQIILIDTLGELINLYQACECVILGGSFVKIGGHNPIECAFFNTKLISGAYIFNQYSLFELIEGYTITQNKDLSKILRKINELPQSYIVSSKINLIKENLRQIYE